ncbi:MAG TPA: wax ester/triacylglycerol synthase family O-acyltransferase [Pseudonocardia sp.]|jgi:WS/DGAT/MGAT family acyltransferase
MPLVPPGDALYLWIETESSPCGVVALQTFNLPEGATRETLDELYAGMTDPSSVKRSFRRRAYRSASTGGQYAWAEDDNLDMSKHVIRHVLPGPGRIRDLLAYVGRIHSTRLDRSSPLWQAHLVEGIEGNQFALCTKMHHAAFDGVNMARHLLGGFSANPEARNCTAPWIETKLMKTASASQSAEPRSNADRVLDAGKAVAASAAALARTGRSALLDRDVAVPYSAPDTIFNGQVDSSRRFAGDAWPIDRLRAVSKRTGTSLNDVAMAMCASALRGYLAEGDALPSRSLVAMVPVSLAGTDAAGTPTEGNAFGAALCSLGTDLPSPMARLEHIHQQMARNKALMADLDPTTAALYSVANMTPTLIATLPRMPRLPRTGFNLVMSNVPGIRKQLYFNGCPLTGVYPVSMVFQRQALNMTMVSYVDQLAFGFVGCARLVPHLQRLLIHLEKGIGELDNAS